jgi:hypothetical protein
MLLGYYRSLILMPHQTMEKNTCFYGSDTVHPVGDFLWNRQINLGCCTPVGIFNTFLGSVRSSAIFLDLLDLLICTI